MKTELSRAFALFLAQNPTLIPDPAPVAPPGRLVAATTTMLAWLKWGGLIGAVAALIAAGIMMAIGARNRNNLAIEGAIRIPWVVAGLALMLGAASLVGFIALPEN
ncbi:hypothetical protein [Allokutzneria multivorans]